MSMLNAFSRWRSCSAVFRARCMMQYTYTFTVKRVLFIGFCVRRFSAKVKTHSERFVKKRQIELSNKLMRMQDPKIEAVLKPLRAAVKEQVSFS